MDNISRYAILREGLQWKSFCEERAKDWNEKPDGATPYLIYKPKLPRAGTPKKYKSITS